MVRFTQVMLQREARAFFKSNLKGCAVNLEGRDLLYLLAEVIYCLRIGETRTAGEKAWLEEKLEGSLNECDF